jgi:hypothetical protein
LVHQLADSTAARIRAEAGQDSRKQIDTLYWRALSRAPSIEEEKASLEALSKIRQAAPNESAALARLCHTIFNSAAFLYID